MSITPFYTRDKNKIFRSNKKKKLFLIGLVISIIVENSIIYLVEPIESKIINTHWLIYELEEIVPDIPSLADFFWLAAYPFLVYSLYFTFKEFYKKYQNKIIVFTSLACGILLVILPLAYRYFPHHEV